ncbi:hypothetical protein N8350_02985 [Candidatus Nanopelagicales bacterium]|jgi:hypothetical protein|nr:hypothetical protein [Candidatus Nanopelagicales bacterium]
MTSLGDDLAKFSIKGAKSRNFVVLINRTLASPVSRAVLAGSVVVRVVRVIRVNALARVTDDLHRAI